MKLAFVGGGMMGEAMIKGILNKKLAIPHDITVGEPQEARRDFLRREYGINPWAQASRAIVAGTEVVVLAIKPQNLEEVVADLKRHLKPGHLVLSIVAGATLGTLGKGLAFGSLVRAMPNTPAQIGEGITVWTATAEVSQSQQDAARRILEALGREIYVSDEKYLDMATAVSGSGPAYVLLFIEALTDAAVHIGLPRDTAEKMVLQTVLGSARLAQVTGKHPAELKNMVTSPGGTTAEGLHQLEKGGLRALITEGVMAAYHKAKALGGSSNK